MKFISTVIFIFVYFSAQCALCQMVADTSPNFLIGDTDGASVATEVPTVDFGTVNLNSAPGDFTHWCNVVLGPDGRFYFGLGDHDPEGIVLLNAYDPVSKTDEVCIDSRNVAELYDGKWHGRPDINPDTGDMYLLGFYQGQLVYYNIYSKQVMLYGKLVDINSGGIEEHTWDWKRNRLYGVTMSGELLVYNTKNHSVVYFGIPSTGMSWDSRSRLLDRETGEVYGSTYNSQNNTHPLMKYNPAGSYFSMLNLSLESGLRSWTNGRCADGAFWIFDSFGNLYRFLPEQDKIEHVGEKLDITDHTYITFIEKSPGGRYFYYCPQDMLNRAAIFQYDTETNQKKIIAFLGNYYNTKYDYFINIFYGGALSADGSSLFLVCNGYTNGRKHPAMFHVHIPESERTDDSITAVQKQEDNVLPENVNLSQNYPNPFNPKTTIKYNLHKSSNVTLKIYNLSGQELETLINEFQAAGAHQMKWQSKGLPSGIYFYRLQAGDFSETKKLILQK